MKRDSGIEFFRVALMLGICILHAVQHGGHFNRWIAGPLCATVNCFVFISGYYGIRFRPSKLIKLYAAGIFCAIVTVTATWLAFGPSAYGKGSFYHDVIACFWAQWFLHAYAVMMLLAAIVESGTLRTCAPVLLLVFGWAFCKEIPGVRSIVPSSPGVAAFSGLTLFGTYCAARLFRCADWMNRIKRRWMLLAAAVAYLGVTALRMDAYSSPFCLILAVIAFVVAGRYVHFRVPRILLPSVFSIYLLHSNGWGFVWLRAIEDQVLNFGCPLFAAYFLTGLILFAGCLILDIPRRLTCVVVKKAIDRFCVKIDECYEDFVRQ